jgi:hypothetical protein
VTCPHCPFSPPSATSALPHQIAHDAMRATLNKICLLNLNLPLRHGWTQAALMGPHGGRIWPLEGTLASRDTSTPPTPPHRADDGPAALSKSRLVTSDPSSRVLRPFQPPPPCFEITPCLFEAQQGLNTPPPPFLRSCGEKTRSLRLEGEEAALGAAGAACGGGGGVSA